jgi:hypothetical protein
MSPDHVVDASRRLLRCFGEALKPPVVDGLQHSTESEPGEPIPLIAVAVPVVLPQSEPEPLLSGEPDVVGAVVPVEHIQADLPAEVSNLKAWTITPDAAEESEVPIAGAGVPRHLVLSPEQAVGTNEHY